MKVYNKKRNKEYRQKVFDHYGWKCKCCNETSKEFLTIDHINDDGYKQGDNIRKHIYSWLIKNNFPKGFQTLCWNCNCSRAIYGKCPHKGPKK